MIIVIGAGAAGLACAVFLGRRLGGANVVVLDGAPRVGAKILASGGTRCNVTNACVTERDFSGGSLPFVRRVLGAFGVPETVAFFREIGVDLQEEDGGKLFPRTGRARTVLDALLREGTRLGCRIETGRRVTAVTRRREGGLFVQCGEGACLEAERVVLATGGQSFPKTGSDGSGFAIARALGHSIVATTPALVPLVLRQGVHRDLTGLSTEVELSLPGTKVRLVGSLLFTHFGVSGPVVLDASRHVLRERIEGRNPRLVMNLLPGSGFDAAERWLLEGSRRRGGSRVSSFAGERLPERLAQVLVASAGLEPATLLSRLTRDERRALARTLVEHELDVTGSRGFDHAEVTAGGVSLTEVSAANLESRRCAGLHFAGEVLDVDGRLGGFNFQWAWSSAWVAARGATGRSS